MQRATPGWAFPAPTTVEEHAGSSTRWLLVALLAAVLGAGLAFRWYLLVRFYVTPDADQTILGLMARHIQSGERPVFYWGQPYTGAAEAYLTAILFTVFGQSDTLLHVAPLLASLAFVGGVCMLAWRLYGPGVAALSGLYLSFAPILLVEWGFWAGSGYLEMMALGTAAIVLALPPPPDHPAQSWWRLPLAFLLLGFAVWVQPAAIFYGLAVLALLPGRAWAVVRAPRRWPAGGALVLCVLAALAAGMAPLLVFNLQHHGQTLAFFTQRDSSHSVGPLTVFSRALLWSGPVVLGLVPPTTDRVYLYHFLLDHYALYGVALGIVLVLLFRGLSLWRTIWLRLRTLLAPSPAADLGLIVLLIVLLAGFLSSSWGAEQWSGSQPRYLLPIYTVLPLILRASLPPRPQWWHWLLAGLATIALCAGNVYTNTTTFGRDDQRPLARTLEQHGITAVYGDYWLVYPLTFDSDERIAGVAVLDDLGKGINRYSPYLRAAAASTHYAWVVATGSARQRAALACLRLSHSRYRTFTWSGQTIYDQPSGRAFPWWNGGRCPTLVPTSPS